MRRHGDNAEMLAAILAALLVLACTWGALGIVLSSVRCETRGGVAGIAIFYGVKCEDPMEFRK